LEYEAGASRENEANELAAVRAAVQRARERLGPESPWVGTFEVLDQELAEGQPFVFSVALAASSRSKRDAPVASA
jgi:hypothetical protein